MDNTREVILGLPQGVRFTALFSVPPASFPLPYPLAPQLHSSSPDTLVTTPHVMQTQPSSWANLDGARVNTNHACVEGLVTVTDQWEPELLVGAQPFPHSFHVKGVQFMYFLAFLCSLPYSAPGNVERRIVQFGKNKGSALPFSSWDPAACGQCCSAPLLQRQALPSNGAMPAPVQCCL